MKIRNGFVSNSSSSSFTIKVTDLTGEQLFKILNNNEDDADSWRVENDTLDGKDIIHGTTTMDNYSWYDYLKKIGVNDSIIDWNSGHW